MSGKTMTETDLIAEALRLGKENDELRAALGHVLARYDNRNAEEDSPPWFDDGMTEHARKLVAP